MQSVGKLTFFLSFNTIPFPAGKSFLVSTILLPIVPVELDQAIDKQKRAVHSGDRSEYKQTLYSARMIKYRIYFIQPLTLFIMNNLNWRLRTIILISLAVLLWTVSFLIRLFHFSAETTFGLQTFFRERFSSENVQMETNNFFYFSNFSFVQ